MESNSSGIRRLYGPALVVATGAVVVTIDQLTKWWASAALADGHEVGVIGRLITLRLAFNSGGAFSSAGSLTWVFGLVSLVVAIGVLWFARRITALGWAVALGGLFGGAASHFGDRILRGGRLGHGYVIDFIDYFGWFIGNVADIAIVLSIVALLWLAFSGAPLRSRRRP